MSSKIVSVTTPTHGNDRFLQLDGLRGAAALIVLVSHSSGAGLLPDVLGGGFGKMGVAIFYMLSGFLMGYLYLSRQPTGVALWNYAVRRAARVLPLFFCVVLLAGTLTAIFPIQLYGIRHLGDFLRNLFIIRGTGVLWSIPVEIHFYIVFAMIWAIFGRLCYPIMVVLVAACGAQIVVVVGLRYGMGVGINAILPCWLHFFLPSSLIGYVVAQKPNLLNDISCRIWVRRAGWLILLSFPLALPQWRRLAGLPPWPINFDPISGGMSVLVFLAALLNVPAFGWLSHPLLVRVGAFSFSLYLLHPLIFDVVNAIPTITAFPGLAFALVVGLSCAVSYVSFRLLELPAQDWIKSRLSRSR